MKYFVFVNVFLFLSFANAQLTTADSTRPISIAPNVLPLRDWHKFSHDELQLNYQRFKPGYRNFYTPPVIPDNPFMVDLRGHPLYTPRFVTDELNLIMNRPRDNAFVPILGAAFLAMQLAQKHLLISEKTAITPSDIVAVPDGLPVLNLLWQHSPQQAEELYLNDILNRHFTMQKLQQLLAEMTENKIIRQKAVEQGPTEYFAALDRKTYIDMVIRGLADSTLTAGQLHTLRNLKVSPYLSEPHPLPAEKKN